MKHRDIVTIGNGTGQGVVLQALRKVTDLGRVSALIGVTDNGGHAGALRREMGGPSMGDVKTVISALTGETVWGQLFRHRFRHGRLTGVSMGNLILTSLMDESGSLIHATDRLVKALNIAADLLPISDGSAQVVGELKDGTEIEGEWEVINRPNREVPLVGVHHYPELITNPNAITILKSACLIIVSPGTLWLGIGSILVSTGVKDAIREGNATIIAIGNVLTQPGVTDGLTVKGHIAVLEGLLGKKINYYLIHDQGLPDNTLQMYLEKGFRLVEDDLEVDDPRIVRGDIINRSFVQQVDRVHYDSERGYPHAMRHDPEMLARIFLHIAESNENISGFVSSPKQERWQVKDF